MTLWFVIAKEPEARIAMSEDGVVTLTGLSRIKGDFSITTDGGATVATPLISNVYHIVPVGVRYDAPIILSFARSAELGTRDATVIYWFNTQLGMWEQIHDVVADSDGVLAVRTSKLGDFALGIVQSVAAPRMLAAFDALKESAPMGTRGYSIAIAYALLNGVPVRLEGLGEHGGCGGQIGIGDHSAFSSSTLSLSVPVDDVDTATVFTVVSEWSLSANGTGCATGEELLVQE